MMAHVSGVRFFALRDEAAGYVASSHTRYRREWAVIRNRAQDAIDRCYANDRHAPTLKEYSDLIALTRRYRVKEGEALAVGCNGRTQAGRGCVLRGGHGGYHRSVLAKG